MNNSMNSLTDEVEKLLLHKAISTNSGDTAVEMIGITQRIIARMQSHYE